MWYAGRYYADTAAHFTPLFHDTAYGGRYLYIIKKKKKYISFLTFDAGGCLVVGTELLALVSIDEFVSN